MAYEGATVDSLLPRRRMGRSERAVLVVAGLALAIGAAAWLTEANSSVGALASFEDRYVPLNQSEVTYSSAALQSPSRLAVLVPDSRLRDAKSELARQMTSPDWRGPLDVETTRPAVTSAPSDIPLPRSRPAAADMQVAAVTAPPPLTLPPRTEDRNMLQKLSDMVPGKFSLASLTPFKRGPDLAALGYDGQTAVYDISARAVYLPSGLRLEAHSGLGNLRDDPEHVDQRMVGATPPATYDLRPREALFHGVRALRLIPVEGSTLGRAGLLAHSYMLGAEGDSNGCVSIRDYERFRKAYEDGEIARLVVVPSLSAVEARASSPS
jgi:hypothetical protein